MNSKMIIKAFLIVALFATSCIAQAPAPTPTTPLTPPPASAPAPPPAPTASPPSPSDVPTASPPAPEGPGVSPGDLSPSPTEAGALPPSAAFSNKAFVVGTAFTAALYAVVLA